MDEQADAPCVEKLVFDTKKQAQAAATTLKWNRGTKLEPYRCRHCLLWHLSTVG